MAQAFSKQTIGFVACSIVHADSLDGLSMKNQQEENCGFLLNCIQPKNKGKRIQNQPPMIEKQKNAEANKEVLSGRVQTEKLPADNCNNTSQSSHQKVQGKGGNVSSGVATGTPGGPKEKANNNKSKAVQAPRGVKVPQTKLSTGVPGLLGPGFGPTAALVSPVKPSEQHHEAPRLDTAQLVEQNGSLLKSPAVEKKLLDAPVKNVPSAKELVNEALKLCEVKKLDLQLLVDAGKAAKDTLLFCLGEEDMTVNVGYYVFGRFLGVQGELQTDFTAWGKKAVEKKAAKNAWTIQGDDNCEKISRLILFASGAFRVLKDNPTLSDGHDLVRRAYKEAFGEALPKTVYSFKPETLLADFTNFPKEIPTNKMSKEQMTQISGALDVVVEKLILVGKGESRMYWKPV